MPKTRPPYPPHLRARLIELVRTGRTPEELGRRFEPSAQTTRNWLRQAERDDGRRADGLTTEEREDVRRSDRGCQYTSLAFGRHGQDAGVRPSMGSGGDSYDNALCESFFATLGCELLDRRRFATQVEARLAVFDFIEGWYTPHRRHAALAYLSPFAYEQWGARTDAARPVEAACAIT